jgi:hypothetical protein
LSSLINLDHTGDICLMFYAMAWIANISAICIRTTMSCTSGIALITTQPEILPPFFLGNHMVDRHWEVLGNRGKEMWVNDQVAGMVVEAAFLVERGLNVRCFEARESI